MTSWENLNRQRRVLKQGAETIAGDVSHGTDRQTRRERDRLAEAAAWLRANRDQLRADGRHPVPELCARFLLSSKQACQAISLAHELDAKEGET